MFYSFFYSIAFCVAAPFLLLSPKSRGKYLGTFRQRLGFRSAPIDTGGRPAIWVHAVSVGEALAAKSLVAELKRRHPDCAVIVSTTTTTGQEIAQRELGADALFYFPFDWRFAYRRLLKGIDVRLCLAMETELWPNFTHVLQEKRIPLLLINGRISDRSFGGYRKHRWFFGPVVRRYHTLCAQSELDGERLRRIGARAGDIVITGNLKYGRGQFEVAPERIAEVRRRFAIGSEEPLFIAASTHEGEEAAALDAWSAARAAIPDLRLMLVPRKPERFAEVAGLLADRGIAFHRWSAGADSHHSPVLLLDAVGWLTAAYHGARIAFVGGSLLPRGGHNLLEACAAGVPVLFGPHMYNFRTVREDVLRAGAGIEVQRPDELVEAIRLLLRDEATRGRMARAAEEVIARNQTALPRTMETIAAAFPWAGVQQRPSRVAILLAKAHAGAAALLRGDPERELARARRLPRPVISVGGLAFGGTGKTPLVSLLADELERTGKRVAILTRGYGGEGPQPLIVCAGEGLCVSVRDAGDEASMLAAKHPRAIIVRDADRHRGGSLAEERFQPDLFILDDGFQHRALGRDVNILTLDADSVVGPRSAEHLLREPLEFAAAADVCIVRGDTLWRRTATREELQRRFPAITTFEAWTQVAGVRERSTAIPLASVHTMRLLAVTGIAAPARFVASLASVGIQPVEHLIYPDHHRFTTADIDRWAALLKHHGADVMITTEKDEQRLVTALDEAGISLRFLVLSVNLRIEGFSALMDLIATRMRQ